MMKFGGKKTQNQTQHQLVCQKAINYIAFELTMKRYNKTTYKVYSNNSSFKGGVGPATVLYKKTTCQLKHHSTTWLENLAASLAPRKELQSVLTWASA